ncbi:zinc-dependent peptidase [bacterium]|nr:zinc-dependent peptidase [bacterium]
MFFFGRRRRGKLLATPLDPGRRTLLHRVAPLCARLRGELAARHEGVVNVLLAEKNFETAEGLVLTDEMRLAVAGQAALLQLHEGAEYYPGLASIILYPESFTVRHERWGDDGLVHEEPDDLSGESWAQGTVVLAWSDVRHEARKRDGYNVVLHEFAHQLDDRTGEANGTPLLRDAASLGAWHAAFEEAFGAHRRLLRRDRHLLFDKNAAESPAEFFATAVELFFEFPAELAETYPAVFACLAGWLELDPRKPHMERGGAS